MYNDIFFVEDVYVIENSMHIYIYAIAIVSTTVKNENKIKKTWRAYRNLYAESLVYLSVHRSLFQVSLMRSRSREILAG